MVRHIIKHRGIVVRHIIKHRGVMIRHIIDYSCTIVMCDIIERVGIVVIRHNHRWESYIWYNIYITRH